MPNDSATASYIISDLQRRVTSAEIEGNGEELLKILRQRNISRLALLANNSIEWAMVDLACLKAGLCILPLPIFFSKTQRKHAINSCAVDAIITDDPELIETEFSVETLALSFLGDGKFSLCVFNAFSNKALIPSGTGKITFTSGSTGQPKGVCLSNDQLGIQAEALAELVAIDLPRHLCLLPLSTLLENVAGVYSPICAGGEVIIPRQEELGFSGSSLQNPEKLLSVIQQLRPDSLILIPQLLLFLLSAAEKGWQIPDSLKFVAVGGSKVSKDLIVKAKQKGLPVYEGYGLSECASVVSLNTPSQDKPGSCGKPLRHFDVSFDNGEVMLAGNVMLGYVNEPESWKPEKIATGDLGCLDAEGFLHINGRKKNLLISTYGRNISPEWIESELLMNPALSEVVVLGDAKPYCAALISVRSIQTLDCEIQQWIDRVNSGLPDYARVKKWRRLDQALQSNSNLMTENGRPRRENINRAFSDVIDQLYEATTLELDNADFAA
ncbi:MAG: long-chain fatty acid--CoA ligase [SAR86 cluster bacterium]|uniref:Long-chain fatty acid--CoA ligase n=1 Tax=SAR86 cluster bacterium TaxID=2030880 RepID=A0A2A5AYU4_9GAMM|nr:MAG: long-chain fatty acid--CoA ligase [SAR86 cluster bacterium]